MIILFSIMIIGFIAAKLKYMTPTLNANISRLLSFVTSPLQIISSVIKPGSHPISNIDTLKLTGIAFAMYIILAFIAMVIAKCMKAEKKQSNCYRYMFIFSNIGFMGYPVIDALFGEEYRFYATVFILMFNLFCWTYGITLMTGEKFRVNPVMLLRPIVLAAVFAYVLYFTKLGMRCPQIVYDVSKRVGDTTSTLAMLIVGCALAYLSPKEVFGNWRTYVFLIFKMILFPIAAWSILRLIITDRLVLGIITIIVSMPIATNSTIICYQFGGDEKLASSGVFLSTLLSVVTVPFLMNLLF